MDLALETTSGDVVGIEIKASESVTATDARHLVWMRDNLGPTFRRGLVVHTGSMTYPLAERIWAVPIAALWR